MISFLVLGAQIVVLCLMWKYCDSNNDPSRSKAWMLEAIKHETR